jgi:hypothetical protein
MKILKLSLLNINLRWFLLVMILAGAILPTNTILDQRYRLRHKRANCLEEICDTKD